MTRAVEFFHLFFTFEMIVEIVNHTNNYAYEHIMEGSHRSYAQKDGSWKEVPSDEIKRLIALLMYFGLVKVGASVDRYWSTSSTAQPSVRCPKLSDNKENGTRVKKIFNNKKRQRNLSLNIRNNLPNAGPTR